MTICITCGMPLEGDHTSDFGFMSADGPVCQFDSENGVMKQPEDIFEGGVNFFMTVIGDDRSLAERLTRSNMSNLPYWQKHPFTLLDGEKATEEEFAGAMAKM